MTPEDTAAQPGQADSACVAFWAPALRLLRDDHNKLWTDSTVGVLQKRSPRQEPAQQSPTVVVVGAGGCQHAQSGSYFIVTTNLAIT